MGSGVSGLNKKTFTSIDSFENSLNGFDDPRLKRYSDKYAEEKSYNKSLENNIKSSIDEDGYDDFTKAILDGEEKTTVSALNALPKSKTPEQLATEQALTERIDLIDKLRDYGKSNGGTKTKQNVQIVVNKG